MRIGINQAILQPVQRTNHPTGSSVQHMRINHSRTHIAVPQQFLYSPYIIPNLQKMGCKRVAEGVTACVLVYPSFEYGLFYSAQHQAFVQVPAAFLAGFGIFSSGFSGGRAPAKTADDNFL